MRYFLKIAYDGTDYHGWQRQPNAPSVQQTIEEALSTILRNQTQIVGAGRTDAGVHASEMYAHLDIDMQFDKKRFLCSLNRMIGHSISVNEIMEVTPGAHARFDAVSRSYVYNITLKKNPFLYRYAHSISRLPDVEKMNQAAEYLTTVSDFTSFSKLHTDTKTNICDVKKAVWLYSEKEALLKFKITADRFLRNMVRAIVGTLLDVGNNKISFSDFIEIIESKDRCEAGASMPGKGLFLSRVSYPKEIFLHNRCVL